MGTIRLPTWYYQQFDADYSREVPAEAFGGWKCADLELAPDRTAVIIMHAWEGGTPEEFPGWHRCEEYFPRSMRICREVFPPLLAAVRASSLELIHVACLPYAARYSGYRRVTDLAGPELPAAEQIQADPVVKRLREFKTKHGFVGEHNVADAERGWRAVDFPPDAKPLDNEWIVVSDYQLFDLCRKRGITHLVYAGFAINWCLLMSAGGMLDMSRHGILCSALRQGVTAVENRESARGEKYKEEGLWRVAVGFGFVYDVDSFIQAIGRTGKVAKGSRQ